MISLISNGKFGDQRRGEFVLNPPINRLRCRLKNRSLKRYVGDKLLWKKKKKTKLR